jgi:predicted amidophosphoribosyltransferase
MFHDFISLLFPKTCVICEEACAKGEPDICVRCQSDLPKTNYHLQVPNELDQRFWGKVNIHQSMAYLKFFKGGSAQRLLYKIKYKKKKETARLIGQWYGYELKQAGLEVDLIVPVPLHEKKLRIRGYNQSEYFALGLSEALTVTYINQLYTT